MFSCQRFIKKLTAVDNKHWTFFNKIYDNDGLPVQGVLWLLPLLLLNTTCPVLANSVDPDQSASEEANWSGSALFVVIYVNFYQKPGSSNLIGWKLKEGVVF